MGWGLVSATVANIHHRFAEQLTLSISLGTLIATIGLLLLHWGNNPITLEMVLGFCATSTTVLAITLYIQKKPVVPQLARVAKQLKSWSTTEKILLGVIATLVAGTLAQNLFWPVTDWDALALYDFRARVVAETGSFAKGTELGYFFQYPPFTSLLHTMLYLTGVNYAKVWYSLIFTALIVGVYTMLRKRSTRLIALIGALLTAVNPMFFEHATVAYTNLSYALFLILGTLYGLEWYRSKATYTGILAGVFVAGSTWVRSTEPLWVVGLLLICVVGAAVTLQKKRWQNIVVVFLGVVTVLLLKQLWPTYVGSLSQGVAQSTPILSESIKSTFGHSYYFRAFGNQPVTILWERLLAVFEYFRAYIFPVFAVYAVPLIALLFLDFKQQKKQWLEWGALVAYIAIIFLGTFLFSFSDGSWDQIGGSAQRMSMFLIPLCIVLLVGNGAWIHKKK